jgi:hypothetical protein
MTATFEWRERGDGQVLWIDDPEAGPGARYLAVRPLPGVEGEWWTVAAVVVKGEAERDVGGELADPAVARDAALKWGIQLLAAHHGVSPSPGVPEEDAPEPERIVARLWGLLAAANVPG